MDTIGLPEERVSARGTEPTIDYVLAVDAEYEEALCEEAACVAAIEQLEWKLDVTRARVVLAAERDGLIDGKNKETRDRQQVIVLASNEHYNGIREELAAEREALGMLTATVTALDSRLKTLRAWLRMRERAGGDV